MWCIVDDERRRIHPQAPCARRVPGGVGQLRRCFSPTMKEHRLRRSALHLTPRHQERNPVYSSDRPQLVTIFSILLCIWSRCHLKRNVNRNR